MSKEREAFEAWLFSTEKFKFRNKNFLFMLDEYGSYEDKPVLEHWETWQAAKAQAVPEGFVLVEKDLIQSIHQSCNNALDINDRDIYKGLCMAIIDDTEAMIEAQQPSSTSGCPDES